MPDVPAPLSLTESDVAEWLLSLELDGLDGISPAVIADELRHGQYPKLARAVLALVEAKVREAVALSANVQLSTDAIVAKVLGRTA